MEILPQSERSQNIKELLKWIEAKSKRKGATLQEIVSYTQREICEMGASQRTILDYIRSLERARFIHTEGLRFLITEQGKNWLERKFLR